LAEDQVPSSLWGADLISEINQAARARAAAMGGQPLATDTPQPAEAPVRVRSHKKSKSVL
jgi:hypothetical protein